MNSQGVHDRFISRTLEVLKACYERRRVRDRVKIVEMDIEDLKFGKEAAKEVQMYRGKVMAAARGYGIAI